MGAFVTRRPARGRRPSSPRGRGRETARHRRRRLHRLGRRGDSCSPPITRWSCSTTCPPATATPFRPVRPSSRRDRRPPPGPRPRRGFDACCTSQRSHWSPSRRSSRGVLVGQRRGVAERCSRDMREAGVPRLVFSSTAASTARRPCRRSPRTPGCTREPLRPDEARRGPHARRGGTAPTASGPSACATSTSAALRPGSANATTPRPT